MSEEMVAGQDPLHVRLRRTALDAPVRVTVDEYEDNAEISERPWLVGSRNVPIKSIIEDAADELERVCAERDALLYTNKALGRLERIVEMAIEGECMPSDALAFLRKQYGEYRDFQDEAEARAALGDS